VAYVIAAFLIGVGLGLSWGYYVRGRHEQQDRAEYREEFVQRVGERLGLMLAEGLRQWSDTTVPSRPPVDDDDCPTYEQWLTEHPGWEEPDDLFGQPVVTVAPTLCTADCWCAGTLPVDDCLVAARMIDEGGQPCAGCSVAKSKPVAPTPE